MFVGLGSGSRVTGFGIVTGVTASIIRIQTDVDYFDKVYLSNKRLDKIRPIEVTLDKSRVLSDLANQTPQDRYVACITTTAVGFAFNVVTRRLPYRGLRA